MHYCTEFHASRCDACERPRRFAVTPSKPAPIEIEILPPHRPRPAQSFVDRTQWQQIEARALRLLEERAR